MLTASIDCKTYGSGPVMVLVPGSCSTGAAWRPIIDALGDGWTYVTTSLLGYGATSERRTADDTSIDRECEVVEEIVRRTGEGVHLVGHSFGGLVSIAVLLRAKVAVAGLTVIEAPALELLRAVGEEEHYAAFTSMTDDYFARFANGEPDAIAHMIDFYGGPGTFASWPPRVRDYAVATTPVNIRDWASARGMPLTPAMLATVDVPTLVLTGSRSHPAVSRANALLATHMPRGRLVILEEASHFMIATHPQLIAQLVSEHDAALRKRRWYRRAG
ncbi:MAG: alpha/beta hydrolase [Hyphomicrobiaceae bacterium]|nr:alpha/beta hydrolase [Hyphomicrobiaceae bacterium]